MVELLFWPVFVALLAFMQGRLLPAIRRTPPGKEAAEQDFALHRVGTFLYGLPLFLVPTWPHLIAAILSRLLLFDVVLNLAARRPAFEVGQTALWDKLLRRLSPHHPERLSAGLRVAVLFAGAALLLSSCAGSKPEPVDSIGLLTDIHVPQSDMNRTPIVKSMSSYPQHEESLLGKGGELTRKNLATPPRRLFGLLPPAQPKKQKVKNSTIIYQVGEGNTATQAAVKKAEAPVQVGQAHQATDNTKAGQKGGAAATAPGAQATATTTKESWLRAVLPYIGGTVLLYSLLPFLPVPGAGWLWLLLRRGRRREPETG
ncbi:hypothetical protein K3G63_10880 [Hymenobacter sp. HSC-4F20]|uniref:hypothetical protein n=1 Tax=Hymenobacter sp. HSC-4F20 TaxID=2864135 RepID=UPI001C7348C2|nr:hypothetical protein [Hymenobacter sp. HSC-4F20]MBX0290946.1 hypothetical protein [Hymenobacter sp. HSC-4F20]